MLSETEGIFSPKKIEIFFVDNDISRGLFAIKFASLTEHLSILLTGSSKKPATFLANSYFEILSDPTKLKIPLASLFKSFFK